MMNDAPPSSQRVTEILAAFAAALDAGDFETAGRMLAADCSYETDIASIAGRVAVVASYAAAARWTKDRFDEVRTESAVEAPVDGTARVTLTDYLLRAGGRFHRYACVQEVTVSRALEIVRIVQRELPGQREALDAYLTECGIER